MSDILARLEEPLPVVTVDYPISDRVTKHTIPNAAAWWAERSAAAVEIMRLRAELRKCQDAHREAFQAELHVLCSPIADDPMDDSRIVKPPPGSFV